MDAYSGVRQLIEDILTEFPESGQHAKQRVAELGYDEDAYTAFFEQFSSITMDAMRASDEYTVREHLEFMSVRFDAGDPKVKEYIDVYYVEPLMWDLSVDAKKWAWSRFPDNLRELYVRMWGEQRF